MATDTVGMMSEKARANWERYIYCRDNGHLRFVQKADRCENFFAGMQWNELDLASLRETRRPALTINKIVSTLSTIFGEQIQNRMEVSYRPKSGAPSENADTLNKVWMSIADSNQLPWVRSDVFADGLIRSRGFYDARIEFGDNMMGEVRISKLNSKNVVIDPDAEEYDPDSWNDVIVTKWLTPMDIELLYSKDAADELRARESSSYLWGFDSIERTRDRFSGPDQVGTYDRDKKHDQGRYIRVLERQYHELVRVSMFVDPINGDTREIPENWDRNRIAAVAAKYGLQVVKQLKKKIKWLCTADSLVLHDNVSPYKHFTPVPYFPLFRDGRTLGIVEHLLGPQELLNKTTSQELHVINTTANSGWKIKGGSLLNMTTEELEERGAQTGLVLELTETADAEKINPNTVPTGLDRLSFKAEEAIKSISNVSDSMQGFDREDVAAKAIAYKQQRGSVNFSKVMDNLERTDWILARNVLDMVQLFYTEERVLNITHEKLTGGNETLVINQENPETGEILNDLTMGEYDVVVTSAPYRATLEDSQFDQAVAMRELGVPIPDDVLIENSRLMRKTELAKRLQAATEDPMAQKKQELELRRMEAEVVELEASGQQKQADAAKKLKEAQSTDGGAEQVMDELALEKYKIDQQLMLEREKMQGEMALQREKMQEELKIKRMEAEERAKERRAQMTMKAAQDAQKAATDKPTSVN
jgi:hypothetical protein